MDLLADQQAGKGGEIQLTDAMARSLDREAMYAVVIDRCRATIPVPRLAGWPPTPSWPQAILALPAPSGMPSTSAAV